MVFGMGKYKSIFKLRLLCFFFLFNLTWFITYKIYFFFSLFETDSHYVALDGL